MQGRDAIGIACLCTAVALVQLLTRLTGTEFHLTQLTMSAYYGLVVIGLCALVGYAGQISLGHAGFFAIGGYLSASLSSRDLSAQAQEPFLAWCLPLLQQAGLLQQNPNLYGEQLLTFTPWAALGVAVAAAAGIALCLGVPVLRLRGHYLAMATLGFGLIIYRLVLASPFLGEADGIAEVPAFVLLSAHHPWGPVAISGEAELRVLNYYFAWAILLAALALLLNLRASRAGRALRALHSAEEAAEASGINSSRYKLQVFVLSAIYAALGGALLSHFNGGIGPAEASVMKSVRYVALVALGGMTNLWGALIMGVGLNFLSLRGVFGSYDDAVFGLILIGVMLWAPQGLPLALAQCLRGRKRGAQEQ